MEQKTIRSFKYEVSVFFEGEYELVASYPNIEGARDRKAWHIEHDEDVTEDSQIKIEKYEIIELDELRNLLTKNRTVLARNFIREIK